MAEGMHLRAARRPLTRRQAARLLRRETAAHLDRNQPPALPHSARTLAERRRVGRRRTLREQHGAAAEPLGESDRACSRFRAAAVAHGAHRTIRRSGRGLPDLARASVARRMDVQRQQSWEKRNDDRTLVMRIVSIVAEGCLFRGFEDPQLIADLNDCKFVNRASPAEFTRWPSTSRRRPGKGE